MRSCRNREAAKFREEVTAVTTPAKQYKDRGAAGEELLLYPTNQARAAGTVRELREKSEGVAA